MIKDVTLGKSLKKKDMQIYPPMNFLHDLYIIEEQEEIDFKYFIVTAQLFIGKILSSFGLTQNFSLKVLKGLLPIRVQDPPYKAQDLPSPRKCGI